VIDVNDLRKGVTFEFDGNLYKVLEYSHNKPGRGNATIRTKLRNLRTGGVLERTFTSGERVSDIRLDHHIVQYLYSDGDLFHFMDTETYEQFFLPEAQMGDAGTYLKEEMVVTIVSHRGSPLDVVLPTFVELAVAETDPGLRGDTASGGSKPATLETGAVIQVPLFINVGDRLRVDTRTGTYIERA
jgi:elongation factor P